MDQPLNRSEAICRKIEQRENKRGTRIDEARQQHYKFPLLWEDSIYLYLSAQSTTETPSQVNTSPASYAKHHRAAKPASELDLADLSLTLRDVEMLLVRRV